MLSKFKQLFFQNESLAESESTCKYLVVPDLHGTFSVYKAVEAYLKSLEPDRVVIFLGDYLDRGESGEVFGREFLDAGSYHTLDAILKLQSWAAKNERKYIFLRGNHEIFFEDFFIKEVHKAYDKYPFFRESVDALEYAFQHDHALFGKFEHFLETLEPFYLDKQNGYLFIHAGIDNSIGSLKEQAQNGVIYWIRDKFLYSKEELPYTVVFGHTPFEEPFIRDYKIGIDCGIYNTGYINLLKIDGNKREILKFPQL